MMLVPADDDQNESEKDNLVTFEPSNHRVVSLHPLYLLDSLKERRREKKRSFSDDF